MTRSKSARAERTSPISWRTAPRLRYAGVRSKSRVVFRAICKVVEREAPGPPHLEELGAVVTGPGRLGVDRDGLIVVVEGPVDLPGHLVPQGQGELIPVPIRLEGGRPLQPADRPVVAVLQDAEQAPQEAGACRGLRGGAGGALRGR